MSDTLLLDHCSETKAKYYHQMWVIVVRKKIGPYRNYKRRSNNKAKVPRLLCGMLEAISEMPFLKTTKEVATKSGLSSIS